MNYLLRPFLYFVLFFSFSIWAYEDVNYLASEDHYVFDNPDYYADILKIYNKLLEYKTKESHLLRLYHKVNPATPYADLLLTHVKCKGEKWFRLVTTNEICDVLAFKKIEDSTFLIEVLTKTKPTDMGPICDSQSKTILKLQFKADFCSR